MVPLDIDNLSHSMAVLSSLCAHATVPLFRARRKKGTITLTITWAQFLFTILIESDCETECIIWICRRWHCLGTPGFTLSLTRALRARSHGLPCAHGPSRAASLMLREANERTTSWIKPRSFSAPPVLKVNHTPVGNLKVKVKVLIFVL